MDVVCFYKYKHLTTVKIRTVITEKLKSKGFKMYEEVNGVAENDSNIIQEMIYHQPNGPTWSKPKPSNRCQSRNDQNLFANDEIF